MLLYHAPSQHHASRNSKYGVGRHTVHMKTLPKSACRPNIPKFLVTERPAGAPEKQEKQKALL